MGCGHWKGRRTECEEAVRGSYLSDARRSPAVPWRIKRARA
jgi:hypothetical protein